MCCFRFFLFHHHHLASYCLTSAVPHSGAVPRHLLSYLRGISVGFGRPKAQFGKSVFLSLYFPRYFDASVYTFGLPPTANCPIRCRLLKPDAFTPPPSPRIQLLPGNYLRVALLHDVDGSNSARSDLISIGALYDSHTHHVVVLTTDLRAFHLCCCRIT